MEGDCVSCTTIQAQLLTERILFTVLTGSLDGDFSFNLTINDSNDSCPSWGSVAVLINSITVEVCWLTGTLLGSNTSRTPATAAKSMISTTASVRYVFMWIKIYGCRPKAV